MMYGSTQTGQERLTVERFDGQEGFRILGERWNQVVNASQWNNVFFTREWLNV